MGTSQRGPQDWLQGDSPPPHWGARRRAGERAQTQAEILREGEKCPLVPLPTPKTPKGAEPGAVWEGEVPAAQKQNQSEVNLRRGGGC